MTDTIICTAVLQPPAYSRDPSKYSVALSLNFEYRGSGYSPAPSEDQAEKRFTAFLQALPNATFRVYRLARSVSSPAHYLEPADWTVTEDPRPSGATPVEDIMIWLSARHPIAADGAPIPQYWVTEDPLIGSPQVSPYRFKLNDLKATHCLGSSVAWAAPLPQNAGLVRNLTLIPTMASPPHGSPDDEPQYVPGDLIIVPFFDSAIPFDPQHFEYSQDPHLEDHRDLFRLTYDAGAGFSGVTAELRFVDTDAMNASGLMDTENGFLVAADEPRDEERVATILKRIEERSASLLWTFPAIQAIERAPQASPPVNTTRLVWLAMNGLATLLDPLVLSLIMPAPGVQDDRSVPNPDGPFVSALAACIQDAWKNTVPAPDTSGLSKIVENALRATLRLNENNTNERSALVALLITWLGIKDNTDPDPFELGDEPATDATVKNAPSLIWLLMKYYAELGPSGSALYFIESATKRFGPLEVALINDLGGLAQQLQADDGVDQLVLKVLPGLEVQVGSQRVKLFDKGVLASQLGIHDEYDRIGTQAIPAFRSFMTTNFNALDAVRHAQARLYELHLVKAAAGKSSPAGVGRWSGHELEEAIDEAQWFVRRLRLTTAGNFDSIAPLLPLDWIAQALPHYAASALSALPHEKNFLTGELERAFATVCGELIPAEGVQQRFVPDAAPKSLQLQIGVDSNPKELGNFVHAYGGLGVLVRRAGREKWAYANLAELTIKSSGSPGPVAESGSPSADQITVVPLQPVAVDQQYSLFLNYDGSPFTSQAFAQTHAPGAASADLPPFFIFDDPSPSNIADFARLSPLAYGVTYDVAAFVIGKGGALPRSTQSDAQPWVPSHVPQIPPPANGRTYARGYTYRRTTAIGRVALSEQIKPGQAKRIGAGIDGVQPLFHDYPRVGIVAGDGRTSVLDLLRNPDGTGTLSLPQPAGSPAAFNSAFGSPPAAGKTTSIALNDVWWWGGPGTLTVSVFAAPDVVPSAEADVAWTFTNRGAFADATLTFEVARSDFNSTLTLTCRVSDANAGQPAPGATQVVDAGCFGDAEAVWLRLAVSSAPARPIALSLADPAVAGDRMTARRAGDSLVLVAPDAAVWQPPYRQAVDAQITFPRVGFNDFDRWLNNPDLAKEAMASGQAQPTADRDRFRQFRRLVLTGYVVRHLDPRLGPLLDSLPDLAVDSLLVELTPLDALYDKPIRVVGDSQKLGVISRAVSIDTLGTRLLPHSPPLLPLPLNDPPRPKEIADYLTKLSAMYSASLEIRSSDHRILAIDVAGGDTSQKLTVTVPRGMVARLTIRPMVPTRYFQHEGSPPGIPPFADHFETLATEEREGHYVFEGASLVIESMVGALAATPKSPWSGPWMDQIDVQNSRRSYEWENLASKAVMVRAGAHRSYDLVAQPQQLETEAHGWWWRQLAAIETATQRWRFTGRPIYSWLDPKQNAKVAEPKNNGAADVAIEQWWDDHDSGAKQQAIARFEQETFFDRDDADTDSRAAQLSPAPHETVLQSFPWEQPSATYFRHRLTIHSRYEGALAAGQIAVQRAWGEDTDKRFGRSWIQVAMLADRTRLQLTRPQLRALLPLTIAPINPEDDTPAATPPVMGILDERPFAHGGLADRIAAEIRTGFGYDLPGSPAVLQIGDARKEFGPDPRLSYMPTAEDDALALTLDNEGPVGLTFDSSNVSAAVFANTALVLHPMRLTAKAPCAASMEEHFLSVSLRRYLDPAWLTAESLNDYAIDRPLWITWSITSPDRGFRLGLQGMQSRDLITVTQEQDSGVWTVWFDAALIDLLPLPEGWGSPPLPLPAPEFKPLCTMYAGAITGLAFLHVPLEKGRASLSVFAQPSAAPAFLGDSAVLAGDDNRPLTMASFEWQVPVGTTSFAFDDDGANQTSANLTSASPTTLMNWTRTGRNFELWHATKGGSFDPYSVSNLVVRWADSSKKRRAFFDARDPAKDARGTTAVPLSFEPHSSRYRNPLYVHRHHAVIATTNAGGFGRPVEVFTEVRRFFGAPFSLSIAPEAVRLVEFETPARPLAWFTPLIKFQTAHFDLVSIAGGNGVDLGSHSSPAKDGALPGLSLFIRPLGSDGTNKSLTELDLGLSWLLPNERREIDIKLKLTPGNSAIRGIILVASNDGAHINFSAQAVDTEGKLQPATVEPASVPTLDDLVSAIELTSKGMKAGGNAPPEFWTDVSLLTLPANNHGWDAFTFDWFFSGGDVPAPADAIKEDALREMLEAQARIIAVSPRIRVEN